jgi:hypothetical protein
MMRNDLRETILNDILDDFIFFFNFIHGKLVFQKKLIPADG